MDLHWSIPILWELLILATVVLHSQLPGGLVMTVHSLYVALWMKKNLATAKLAGKTVRGSGESEEPNQLKAS